jgi:hypothetical protein
MTVKTAPVLRFNKYGSITVNGREVHSDIIIYKDGRVEQRRNILCDATRQTPCTIQLGCLLGVCSSDVDWLIIGTGHHSRCTLSKEAAAFYEAKGCQVRILPTKEAVELWNTVPGLAIGLFHTTC